MIDTFNSKHPDIQVEMIAEPYNSMVEQLLVLNASGQAPDVMQIHSSWTAALQGAGALANLDGLADQKILDDFYPNVLDALRYDGHLYALPWSPTPVVLFYNKTLLKKAGYTNPPKTLSELAEMAAAVAKLGSDEAGNKIYGLGLQSKAINMTGIHFMFYLWSHGGEVVDEAGNITINSQGTISALNFMRKLMDDGASPVGLEIKDLRNVFVQGLCGFHIDGADYALNTFKALAKDPAAFMDQVGVAELPSNPAMSPEGNSFFIEHNLGVSSSSANKKEALALIEWLSSPEAVSIWNDVAGNRMPSRKSAADTPYYKDPSNEMLQTIIAALGKTRMLPEKNTGFLDGMIAIANGIQRVCINHEDSAVVVLELETELKEIYGRD
jgi:multiple sugar transport system substrate-binding protein